MPVLRDVQVQPWAWGRADGPRGPGSLRRPVVRARPARWLLAAALVWAGATVGSTSAEASQPQRLDASEGSWNASIVRALVADCKNVYVDVGTNIGVQLRKLFEPRYYPDAPVLTYYDQYFGKDRVNDRTLCAFGFEPSPHLTPRLAQIEDAYRRRGWRINIFTQTAAGTRDGMMDFWYFTGQRTSSSSFVRRDFSKGKQPGPGGTPERAQVTEVDLSRFLQAVHARPRAREGKLLIKIDIEGKEVAVVPSLLEQDALCAADVVMVEWHDRIFQQNLKLAKHESGGSRLAKVAEAESALANYRSMFANAKRGFAGMHARGCKAQILTFDDETYWKDEIDGKQIPLP